MENRRTPILPNQQPFAMIIYSSVFVVMVGLAFQLIGMLLTRVLFGIPVSDLLNLGGDIDRKAIAALKFLQIFGALGTFVFSSFLISFFYTGSWTGFFTFGRKISGSAVVLLMIIMIAALPLVNFLTEINLNFQIPFDGVERYFRAMEENVDGLMKTLINADSFGGLLVNLFMIAIIPAVGEELVFRGLIQRHLTDLFKSPHIAIVIASVVFSLAHFQIYSFLPRLFLGLILGYTFYYGKSLWYPMIAHLLNNSLGVVFYYIVSARDELTEGGEGISKLEEIGTRDMLPAIAIASLLLVVAFLYVWVKMLRTNQTSESGQV